MSLIEDIKRDREVGTPGPWGLRYPLICGKIYGSPDVVPEGKDEGGFDRVLLISGAGGSRSYTNQIVEAQKYDDAENDAKRIARVPEMEATLLEMYEALTGIINSETYALHVGYDSGSGGGNYVYADAIRTDDEDFINARAILAKMEGRS